MAIAVVERLSGLKFTDQTIARMWDLVKKAKTNWSIIMLATKITERCPEKHWYCTAQAIHDWVLKNIKYVKDVNGVEVLQHPLVTIGQRRAGDCDDLSMVEAALLGAIGIATQFRTIKADPTRPNEYSHVYLAVYVPRSPGENWRGGWVHADPTVKQWPFGRHAEGFPGKNWPEPEAD